MATYYGVEQTIVNGPAYGQPLANRVKSNRLGGRIRYAEFLYNQGPTAGASTTDKIIFGKLPAKARVIGHLSKLYFTAGGGTQTITIGDAVQAARYLASTSTVSAGSALLEANAITNTITATTVAGSNVLTACTTTGGLTVGANITGTGVATGTYITAVDHVAKTCTLSAVASASGTTVTMTTTSGSYEVNADDNTVANAFGATTDDCTIVGQIGATLMPIAQTFVLKIAYVMD